MVSLTEYRSTDRERQRTDDLLRILPKGYRTVLDVGARDGHFSLLLGDIFDRVTALDIELPPVKGRGITGLVGSITALPLADRSFDVVFCTEVLEHIVDLRIACSELRRVAAHSIVLGVPFEQDLRIGETYCTSCRRTNPPWGHVNTFSKNAVLRAFPGWNVDSVSYVALNYERTNAVAVWLMRCARNPWGTYSQDERCIHCGSELHAPPAAPGLFKRACGSAAAWLQRAHTALSPPRPSWMHIVLRRQ